MSDYNSATALNNQLTIFDSIYERYIASYGNNPKIEESISWLKDRLKAKSDILDIGCGTAKLTAPELIKSNHNFTGIDSSIEMLKIARKNSPESEFILDDFSEMKINKQYDAITAYFSLLMLPKSKIESTLKSIVEILKSNGFLIISMIKGDFDFIEIPFSDLNIFLSAYNTEDFKTVLRNLSLKVIKTEEIEYFPDNGAPDEIQQFFYCQKKH